MSKKILNEVLLSLVLSCSPEYQTKNVHPISVEQAVENARKGVYDYISIHSAGSVYEDTLRQNLALDLQTKTYYWKNFHPILLLNGYYCKNSDGTSKTLEQTFNDDERLAGRLRLFSDSKKIEIAYSHDTPANTRELRLRKNQEKTNILVVTSDYHVPRVSQTTSYYFTENMPEKIDVTGVPTKKIFHC